jgi:hypothetical protein
MRVASGHSLKTPRIEQSHEGRQRGCWVPRGGDCDIPHHLDSGYRNGDVLIYIFASFLIQHALKL